jgi:uncharacterized membrane protein YbhN (UPF0104 family)
LQKREILAVIVCFTLTLLCFLHLIFSTKILQEDTWQRVAGAISFSLFGFMLFTSIAFVYIWKKDIKKQATIQKIEKFEKKYGKTYIKLAASSSFLLMVFYLSYLLSLIFVNRTQEDTWWIVNTTVFFFLFLFIFLVSITDVYTRKKEDTRKQAAV